MVASRDMTLWRTSKSTVTDALYEAETALSDPAVRCSRDHVEALLHPDFSETGSSGEVYDRAEMVDMMTMEDPGEVLILDFKVRRVTDDFALVTYRSVGMSGREARRSSVWVNTDDRWQLLHHQGTRVPDRRSSS